MAITFAEALKRHRAHARLTQEELAERAGISARAVSDLERGLYRAPRATTLALLIDALDLSPAERTAFEEIASGDGESGGRLTPHPTVTNLLPAPTSFIGREREVGAVCEQLLRPDVRLLTLVGPGGAGKTRLAMEVVAGVADRFADGARVIALAPVTDPALVASAIARALGPGEVAGRSLEDILEAHLRDKELLLVLDNFEQVTSAAPLLMRLLMACPKLTMLVTSRVVLHLSAEHSYEVPPLTLPPAEPRLEQSRIEGYEAVRLFVERAQAARSDFVLTQEDAPAVAEICRRLDGLPLAIELAASRVRLLPPRAMLARLGHGLALLSGGAIDLPHRQRTLRATLDWSHELLTEAERRLLRHVAVFADGFDLEAAEAISPSEGGLDVLEGISSLIDQSLVRRAEPSGWEPRFVLLETVREYAQDKLVGSGEADLVHGRHAEYYLTLAEMADVMFRSEQQGEWLDRLEVEHDNMRAALAWTIDRAESEMPGMADLGARLAGALGAFWLRRSYHSEGRRWLGRVLALSGASPSARARALERLGLLSSTQGEYERAIPPLEESLAILREMGDPLRIAWALCGLGGVVLDFGDHARVRALCSEALELFGSAGEKVGMAEALHRLGDLAREQGDHAQATDYLEHALKLYRSQGEGGGVAWALNGLGDVAVRQGNWELALARYHESVALLESLGQTWGVAIVLCNIGTAARRVGELTAATASFERGLTLARQSEDVGTVALALIGLAAVARSQGDDDRAAALFREGLGPSWRLGTNLGVARILEGLAGALSVREPGRAAQLFGAAESMREAVGIPIPLDERVDYDRDIAAAHTRLGDRAFAQAWAEGRAMTPDRAVAYASGAGSLDTLARLGASRLGEPIDDR